MIKGLDNFFNEEEETLYYSNEKMYKDGFIIEENTIAFEMGHVETWIDVHQLKRIGDIDMDAATYTMYNGDMLVPIQTYRIIKDIIELYESNNAKEFAEIMHGNCVQHISASMQSKKANSTDVYQRIKKVFDFVADEKYQNSNQYTESEE